MTTANKITIGRILFVPVFISVVIFYGRTELDGYRVMAILVFALTSISDAVDGYIARHYNQKSELGAILDPLADKLTQICTIASLLLVSRGIKCTNLPPPQQWLFRQTQSIITKKFGYVSFIEILNFNK